MIKKLKLVLAVIGLSGLMIGLFGFISPSVHASAKDDICKGAGLVGGSDSCSTPTGTAEVEPTLQKGMNLFTAIVGIIAVVMFIVGGLKYITSQGDPGNLNSAKNTLIYASVGLVIVALAQIIVRFVLKRFTV